MPACQQPAGPQPAGLQPAAPQVAAVAWVRAQTRAKPLLPSVCWLLACRHMYADACICIYIHIHSTTMQVYMDIPKYK